MDPQTTLLGGEKDHVVHQLYVLNDFKILLEQAGLSGCAADNLVDDMIEVLNPYLEYISREDAVDDLPLFDYMQGHVLEQLMRVKLNVFQAVSDSSFVSTAARYESRTTDLKSSNDSLDVFDSLKSRAESDEKSQLELKEDLFKELEVFITRQNDYKATLNGSRLKKSFEELSNSIVKKNVEMHALKTIILDELIKVAERTSATEKMLHSNAQLIEGAIIQGELVQEKLDRTNAQLIRTQIQTDQTRREMGLESKNALRVVTDEDLDGIDPMKPSND